MNKTQRAFFPSILAEIEGPDFDLQAKEETLTDLFEPFPKMARLSREVVVTEKIDGSNAQIYIEPVWPQGEGRRTFEEIERTAVTIVGDLAIYAGSRNRMITPGKSTDNMGFAAWVHENAAQLYRLGPGRHFGEWYGKGIQRGYGMQNKRFALFNVGKWTHYLDAFPGDQVPPLCCDVVPVLYRGVFDTQEINAVMADLKRNGSYADDAKGFSNPEGIIVWHTAANIGFKKTFDGDEHKGQQR